MPRLVVDKPRIVLVPDCVKVEVWLMFTIARVHLLALSVSQTMQDLTPKQLIKTSTAVKYSIKLSNNIESWTSIATHAHKATSLLFPFPKRIH